MPEDTKNSFAGLPLGLLICSPIIEVAHGQSELCRVYLEYVFKLAYKEGKVGGETNTIEFVLERPVTDGTGHYGSEKIKVTAPVISLVPVPAFVMQEATVQFTMEVKSQVVDTTSKTATATATIGGSKWGFSAQITGTVTAGSTNTRQSDQSAKYDIMARAIQQPPAEGMAKLTTVFASVIEPIPL